MKLFDRKRICRKQMGSIFCGQLRGCRLKSRPGRIESRRGLSIYRSLFVRASSFRFSVPPERVPPTLNKGWFPGSGSSFLSASHGSEARMATVALVSLGCGSLSRVGRRSRSDEANELPLFKDLTDASNSKMLYPFSNPNEVELSLATVTCARLKRVPSWNLAIKTNLNSDLLKNEFDKTECNWLVTPPDSPLFPSLDFEPNWVVSRSKKPNSPLSRMSKREVKRKREAAVKKNRGSEEKLHEKQLESGRSKRLKNRAMTWRHVGTMGRF